MCEICVATGTLTQGQTDRMAQETMDACVDATMEFVRVRRHDTSDLGTNPVNMSALAESLAGEIMFKVNHASTAYTLALLAIRLQDALDRESGTIVVNKPPKSEGDANTGFYV
jgi:hypothetical protein